MTNRQIAFLVAVLGLMAVGAIPSQALDWDTFSPSKTYTYQLENELKILVRVDRRAPILVSQIWYRVGSSYEPPGLTGVSHVLEHLMFRGSEKLPPGHFSKLVSLYGGDENAFTNRDYTGYYQTWEKSRLPISFELEADRMQNLVLQEGDFQRELKVVMEERRQRTDDKPSGKTYEHFMAIAYASSPYQQPVIGWMHDLEALKLSDVQNWYDKWYAPNNATIVVVGDVDPDQVFALAKEYFAHIPKKILPKVPLAQEIEPLGKKKVTVALSIEVPELYMAFHTPSLGFGAPDWEIYALTLLASILDGGYSARFETELVRGKKVAASVGAGYSGLSRGASQFVISGIPAKGETLESLEKAIRAELNKVKQALVSESEIKRVLAQTISSKVFLRDSISSQARELGILETLGYSWRLADEYPKKLTEVTPEQIQAVAKKYFISKGLTIAELVPETDELNNL